MHLLALVGPLPYPFIYLKDEKGTPFGRSPPVYCISHYRE